MDTPAKRKNKTTELKKIGLFPYLPDDHRVYLGKANPAEETALKRIRSCLLAGATFVPQLSQEFTTIEEALDALRDHAQISPLQIEDMIKSTMGPALINYCIDNEVEEPLANPIVRNSIYNHLGLALPGPGSGLNTAYWHYYQKYNAKEIILRMHTKEYAENVIKELQETNTCTKSGATTNKVDIKQSTSDQITSQNKDHSCVEGNSQHNKIQSPV